MGDCLRIARAYLSGKTAAVWCFLFLGLLAVSIFDGEFARNQGGILGGVLLKKSYMAMFAYFNACLLGVLLSDNIAHPWASVLPHYRRKHLLVTALIAAFFIGIPMFSVEFMGTSDIAPTSVGVIFLTCLAAGLWTLHNPVLGGVLAIPFLVFVVAPSSSSPGLAAFLAGTSPTTSAALVVISLLALWAFALRLLALNEDTLGYAIARMWGDFLRGRGGDIWAEGIKLPGHKQTRAKTIDDSLAALPAPFATLKQVDKLSGYSERSLWKRLQLWRLGTAPTRTSASVGWLMLITPIVIAPIVFITPLVGAELPARDTVVIFSVQVMTNPVTIWLFWFKRCHRLGYESLRARTRQEFVRELGLALLWDITLCWLGGVLFLGIAAAIWAPELLQVKNMLLFILFTGVGQLFAYAMMGIWLLRISKRGMVASVSCAFCPFMAIALWMVCTMNGSIRVEVNTAVASVLAAASVATIPLAYRRWCQADLD